MVISSLFVEGGKVTTIVVYGNDVVLVFQKDESDRDREDNKNDNDEEKKRTPRVDDSTLYYVTMDVQQRPYRVYR